MNDRFSLHAYKNGFAVLCDSDEQRARLFERGALPIATFNSLDEARPVVDTFTALRDDGTVYLTAARDNIPLELDDLLRIRQQIDAFRNAARAHISPNTNGCRPPDEHR